MASTESRTEIRQEGLAVASVARDDPPTAAAMFVGDRMMASTSPAGAAAVFPACTATQCTSVTDRQAQAQYAYGVSR